MAGGERQPGAAGDDVPHRFRLGRYPGRADAAGQQLPGLGGGEQVERE
jgi:hypothetical protein